MSYLKNKRCYIGGPIEHFNSDNWRIAPKKTLVEAFGINVFDPYADPKQQWVPELEKARKTRDLETMHQIASQFVRKDMAIVDRTDFGIWNLPYKVPTTGSTEEIISCNRAKKPTILVCEQGREYLPVWFHGYKSLRKYMFDNFEQVYQYLHEVESGIHQNDPRWDFVYGLI
jgi:nucleoside 2-deoxyribosyltransferase